MSGLATFALATIGASATFPIASHLVSGTAAERSLMVVPTPTSLPPQLLAGRRQMEEPAVAPAAESVSDDQVIGMPADRARNQGLRLTGEGGVLQARL
ncbi:hypothetical protein ACWCQ1_37985 [Streptomyces sp. NPDC002144]|uniref:hypothetical protein n=1 Tax=Streptomyces sp. NPDC001351 TaxID=3364564 RepID=UPI0036B235FF